MDANRLNHVVRFLVRAADVDTGLGSEPAFAAEGPVVWADRRDVTDVERWRASEIAAEVGTRFTVRWSPYTASITPRDRLVCEGRIYEITGLREVGRREWIEFGAVRRIDGAGDDGTS